MSAAAPAALRLPRPRRTGAVLTLGAAALGWALLVAGETAWWGRYLDHGAVEASSGAAALAVFAAGWTVMLAAMMLPTTYPLVARFTAVVARRPDGGRLVAAVVGGYATVWAVAGLVAFAADAALHALDDRIAAVDGAAVVPIAALALAGAYQLTGAKARCLDRCRDPRALVVAGWHGRRPLAEAFDLGRRHGAACLGCCWALMLLLVGIGAGHLGTMLVVSAAMATEKVAPGGDRIRVPVGVALLVAAVVAAALALAGG